MSEISLRVEHSGRVETTRVNEADLPGRALAIWHDKYRLQDLTGAWLARYQDNALDPWRSFVEQRVRDGAQLQLIPANIVTDAARQTAHVVDLINESADRLPERHAGLARAGTVLSAALGRGRREPTGPAPTLLRPQKKSLRDTARQSGYVVSLDAALNFGRLTRCGVIAVVGSQGSKGVGRSTVSAVLAAALRAPRSRAVAVLTEPGSQPFGRAGEPLRGVVPAITAYLASEGATPLQVANLFRPGVGDTKVCPARDEFDVLAVQNPDTARRALLTLRERLNALIIDCGPELFAPPTRTMLEVADQIVVVADIANDDVRAPDRVAQTVYDLIGLRKPMLVVANRWRSGDEPRRLHDLLHFLPEEADPFVALLDEERSGVQALRDGSFSLADAPMAWQDSARELAALAVQNWRRIRPPIVEDA